MHRSVAHACVFILYSGVALVYMIMDDHKWIALQYVLKFALDHIKGLYEPIYKYQSFLRVFMLLECHRVASSPGPLKGESPGDNLLVVTSSNLSQLKLHYSDLCNHKIRYMYNCLHSNLYVCQSSCVECNVCTIHILSCRTWILLQLLRVDHCKMSVMLWMKEPK